MRDLGLRPSFSVLLVTAGLLVAGCPADREPPSADGTGSSGGVDSTGSTISATGQGSGNADSTGGTTSDGMDSAGFLPGETTDGGSTPLPNGGMCTSPLECESGYCYQIPMLGGVCSECLEDAHCDMGTCSLDPAALYAVCTDGSLGVMCDSDEGCMGDLVCTSLVNTGGLIPADFCSECRDGDLFCEGEQVCSPVYDLAMFQGYHACLDPGSVPNGGGCPLNGLMGDGTVCASGMCGVATLLNVIPLGVCGECLDDMDCMGPSTCQPPSADMSGLMGATCI